VRVAKKNNALGIGKDVDFPWWDQVFNKAARKIQDPNSAKVGVEAEEGEEKEKEKRKKIS
jgi:hypothetical protein